MLCVPLRNRDGQPIGVTQVLNKRSGTFGEADVALAEAINRHAASALEQAILVERLEQAQREEIELLTIAEAISTELHLDMLFTRIMAATTQLLNAERSTLFMYDARAPTNCGRRSPKAPARSRSESRRSAGIAGAAFTGGEVLMVPDAYADPRFNPRGRPGFGLPHPQHPGVPIIDTAGERLGVVQVLNKRGGPFTPVDIRRPRRSAPQIAIAIQNAQLFSDVLSLKNYNESILKSLSNGVITLDQNLNIVKVNEAAERILGMTAEEVLEPPGGAGLRQPQRLGHPQPRIRRRGRRLRLSRRHRFALPDGSVAAVNLTAAPLVRGGSKPIGCMLVIEDITREKRVRNTMARYVAKEVVDRLIASGAGRARRQALTSPPCCSPTSAASRCWPRR